MVVQHGDWFCERGHYGEFHVNPRRKWRCEECLARGYGDAATRVSFEAWDSRSRQAMQKLLDDKRLLDDLHKSTRVPRRSDSGDEEDDDDMDMESVAGSVRSDRKERTSQELLDEAMARPPRAESDADSKRARRAEGSVIHPLPPGDAVIPSPVGPPKIFGPSSGNLPVLRMVRAGTSSDSSAGVPSLVGSSSAASRTDESSVASSRRPISFASASENSRARRGGSSAASSTKPMCFAAAYEGARAKSSGKVPKPTSDRNAARALRKSGNEAYVLPQGVDVMRRQVMASRGLTFDDVKCFDAGQIRSAHAMLMSRTSRIIFGEVLVEKELGAEIAVQECVEGLSLIHI